MKLKILLDGDVQVCFPDGAREIIPVNRLTILNDFADELNLFGDAISDGYIDELFEEAFPFEASAIATHELLDRSMPQDSPDVHMEHEAWKHLDESVDDEKGPMDVDSDGRASTPMSEPRPSIQSSPYVATTSSAMPPQLPSTSAPHPSSLYPSTLESDRGADWRSFVILPTAPKDHAFISQVPPAQPTKTFLQRLNKEYKVLSSSLPGKTPL